ncbi:MAG: antibiotic biosynthesis monooxygenase [Rhodospirillales bacterium]|jgi:quinol monooxygenase YgiN|nr:antibiotic biosynthesis monooxygenase [Rhodospirillales bacterium]
MSAIAIFVEYDVKPESRDAFKRVIGAHAKGTLEDEDGCECFHVLSPREDSAKMMVYEVYRDAEALAVHNRSPRLPQVREDYKDMITDKRIVVSDIV